MKISYSIGNTHIEDSYLITMRKSIANEVNWIVENRKAQKLPITRSNNSYIREWKGHNRLYKKNIKRDHTKDVDLEERLTPKEKIKGLFMDLIWLIIGGI